MNELFGLSEIINWLGYIKLNLFTLNGTDFSEAQKDCYLLLLTKDIYFNCYLKSIKIIANSGDFDMVYRLKVQFLVIEQEDETVRTMGRDKYRSALKRTPSQLCSFEGEKIYFICKVFNYDFFVPSILAYLAGTFIFVPRTVLNFGIWSDLHIATFYSVYFSTYS